MMLKLVMNVSRDEDCDEDEDEDDDDDDDDDDEDDDDMHLCTQSPLSFAAFSSLYVFVSSSAPSSE